jgi:hypothetical protein
MQVQSFKHAMALVATSETHRKVSCTHYNQGSSRSHVLCRISIESCTAEARSDRIMSTFNLIDLAGSESARVATSIIRRKEGAYINKSLLTLGAVISKLAEGSAAHIPFRDSKITRLLQSSLSGAGAKVAVVCCITPASGQVRLQSVFSHFLTCSHTINAGPCRAAAPRSKCSAWPFAFQITSQAMLCPQGSSKRCLK